MLYLACVSRVVFIFLMCMFCCILCAYIMCTVHVINRPNNKNVANSKRTCVLMTGRGRLGWTRVPVINASVSTGRLVLRMAQCRSANANRFDTYKKHHLSSYENLAKPGTILVARCWTPSNNSISCFRKECHTTLPYSKCGRTTSVKSCFISSQSI